MQHHLCLNSLVLNDKTAKKKLSDNSVNKEVITCFDTSKVTNTKQLFQDTLINTDLSSWNVSSDANIDVVVNHRNITYNI